MCSPVVREKIVEVVNKLVDQKLSFDTLQVRNECRNSFFIHGNDKVEVFYQEVFTEVFNLFRKGKFPKSYRAVPKTLDDGDGGKDFTIEYQYHKLHWYSW